MAKGVNEENQCRFVTSPVSHDALFTRPVIQAGTDPQTSPSLVGVCFSPLATASNTPAVLSYGEQVLLG